MASERPGGTPSQRETEPTGFARRAGLLLALLGVLLILGAFGYAGIEGTSVPYGFEWAVDTVTTVGAIPDPSDAAGRVLRVLLELLGVGTLFYGLALMAEFFVSGRLSGVLERRRTQNMINRKNEHIIVCGYGRVGRQVVRDLRASGVELVVVDFNPAALEQARVDGLHVLEGDPSEDEMLERAGISRARAVIACVDSDPANIFITLSARQLRADVPIVARASREDSEKKLLRAGADRVVSPYKASGTEMARVALRPQIGGAVSMGDLRVEEIEVPASCVAVGRRIGEVRGLAAIVALRSVAGVLDSRPSTDRVIEAGDMLVAVGNPATLEEFETSFQPRDEVSA